MEYWRGREKEIEHNIIIEMKCLRSMCTYKQSQKRGTAKNVSLTLYSIHENSHSLTQYLSSWLKTDLFVPCVVLLLPLSAAPVPP